MKRILILLTALSAILTGCDKSSGNLPDPSASSEYLIVNEGQYGTPGSIDRYVPATGGLTLGVYDELGQTGVYGQLWDGVLYVTSKQDKILTAINPQTFQTINVLGGLPDGRAFCGIDKQRGVVTTADGAFIVTLDDLQAGDRMPQSDGQCGAVCLAGSRLFVHSQQNGVLVYDVTAGGITFRSLLDDATQGFAIMPDGSVWAADDKELLRIDPKTLAVERVLLPVSISASWGSWNPGSLSASPTEKVLYFIGDDGAVYRYVYGKPAEAIITAPEGYMFYGSGIDIDPATGNIVALMTSKGNSTEVKPYYENRVAIYSPKGVEQQHKEYSGYRFPSMVVFVK